MKTLDTITFWDDLVEYIDDRRVVPIVGGELSRVLYNGKSELVERIVAERLAQRLGVAVPGDSETEPINTVAVEYLVNGGRREDLYPRVRNIMRDLALPVPDSLRKLAGIRQFNLFVTTTFDSLLEHAIDLERFGGAQKTLSIGYSPNGAGDLPANAGTEDRPVVFHLLGKVSSLPDYVVTDEDTLEFLYALQSERGRPERLFDALRSHHLLLMGTGFPDWLARFFLRLAKGSRLSGQRDSLEVVADKLACADRNLILFLQNFSYRTRIFQDGGASEFVDQLCNRLSGRKSVPPPAAENTTIHAQAATKPASDAADNDEMPPGAVFLSYASEDRPVVKAIHDALDAADVEVWFDQGQLAGGDDFDKLIRRHIKNCSLFLPIVSKQTEARLEGYFRLEWRLAAERALQIAEGVPFIVPICIDNTDAYAASVPGKFREVQWIKLEGGRPTNDLCERVRELVREYHRRKRGGA
ncbi:MAG: toll/interleukin-1 receptor domain-containing protein [Phycisphaeraceae bacterium]|nr:toll/interleukin-1 receptor domain-containing protein [Phycisphaeraceae bacterium]